MEKWKPAEIVDHSKEDVDQKMVTAISNVSHDVWRKPRWREESKDYEPRFKKTNDAVWSEKHGGATEVDIANSTYEELPSDWQAETKASVTLAVQEVEAAVNNKHSLDSAFIEGVAAKIHDAWRDRRRSEGYSENDPKWEYAKSQMVDYVDLTEDEKQKDRDYVELAIKFWKQGTNTDE